MFIIYRSVVSSYTIRTGVILEGSQARRNISLKTALVDLSSNLKSNETQIRQARNSGNNDVVSKNITIILENLLKNYESSQLPSHGKGLSNFS